MSFSDLQDQELVWLVFLLIKKPICHFVDLFGIQVLLNTGT